VLRTSAVFDLPSSSSSSDAAVQYASHDSIRRPQFRQSPRGFLVRTSVFFVVVPLPMRA
jgi:hypothetical protein